ncbi:Hypothetical_protein [Hexamita inflata]|uniref:Hypothetical_protein n=1 Tax=Hexamita inflata TaxID=28002 RepID=A0ABP1HH29_9EUKA
MQLVQVALLSAENCFNSVSINIDQSELFQFNLTYDSACQDRVENWTTLSIQVQIERSDVQINCQYQDIIFTDLIQLSCDCDQSDQTCLDYKQDLLDNYFEVDYEDFIIEQIHSFTYVIGLQVYDSAGQQIYDQVLNVDFTENKKFNYNYLFLIVLVFFFPLSAYLIFKYIKNIINKCKQLKQEKLKTAKKQVIYTPHNSQTIYTQIQIVVADEKSLFEII